ncbi:hypothetical protein HMPREF0591_1907 [Mycobacterium parascrofulaceum ATCC BAA-614]|uniref:Cell division protein SepF n=2 Tax=Mycobacterium TaxID=1763 RepID=D5P6W3_9MYCO|nr:MULTISPECIES: cell division protein SepF [Mycobacterium]EFG78189.1 hypothetical protein HMPREF0591_1907 [Mycobacterium parascrofulaceum ATCC BAA-614]OCB55847.1 cell division protein SepF [Mycobacterium malmoense]OCB59005.1 cell division protein SepF [Mycobacterium malmoense]
MSTLHKVKAYFGMAPMDDYDDEYYDDHAPSRGFPRPRFDDGYGRYEGRDYDDPREPADYPPPGGYRGGYGDEPRYGAVHPREVHPREFERPEMGRPRFGSWLRNSTRGALAMDPRRMAMMFEEGHPLSKITTLRPKDYSEARTIGERFRDGTPVIMDLVSMDNADAKRLVDFAAGLAFALRGSFDKVATKVFLLSPADVDVSPEERRRIAETGFYAYQ